MFIKLYESNKGHSMIGAGLHVYAQITSPIRRIVDLINMTLIQIKINKVEITEDILSFIDFWNNNMGLLNKNMKNIKKIQNNCYLLDYCLKLTTSEKSQIEGYVISKEPKNKNDLQYKYEIFIPSLNIVTKTTSNNDYLLYNKYNFSIHIFVDENTFHKKIRVQFNQKCSPLNM